MVSDILTKEGLQQFKKELSEEIIYVLRRENLGTAEIRNGSAAGRTERN